MAQPMSFDMVQKTPLGARAGGTRGRLRETAELFAERGFSVDPERLAALCVGGPVSRSDVMGALAAGELVMEDGIAVAPGHPGLAARSRERADRHLMAADRYLREARGFARLVCRLLPFVRAVALAGSLAAGGFQESDDVDLNLLVDDRHRHLAYLLVNALGYAHALGWRGKPVDESSRRPLAPRLMTVNLILEPCQWRPLARTDAQMALELLLSRPLTGGAAWASVTAANPALLATFPQLDAPVDAPEVPAVLPGWLFPGWLDTPARWAGRAAWRWLQWTRRRSPGALARVRYVRATMRPYALFEDGS